MKFETGQKVRCVDGSFAYNDKIYPNKPKLGQVITVRATTYMERNDGYDQYLTFEEIINPPINGYEPAFNAIRFELVATTKTLAQCWEIADLDDLAPPQAKALQFLKLARQNGHFL